MANYKRVYYPWVGLWSYVSSKPAGYTHTQQDRLNHSITSLGTFEPIGATGYIYWPLTPSIIGRGTAILTGTNTLLGG